LPLELCRYVIRAVQKTLRADEQESPDVRPGSPAGVRLKRA
jgi:hypothetical protein